MIHHPVAGGRPAHPSRAAVRRRSASPVTKVVAGVVAVALAASLYVLVGPYPGGRAPLFSVDWLHGPGLIATLVALTCAGELVAVRMYHRDAVEELTLIDPMLLLDVLLLPPREALLVGVSGLALAYLIRRRAAVKTVFNLGTYAAAAAVLIVLVRACVGTEAGFDLRLVVALGVGLTGFVAVNLLSMSVLLAALEAGSVLDLIRRDVRLSAFTMIATLALGAQVLALAIHTPVFLPFTVLPAAAITYAYRATATQLEERQRSALVLHFSQALAASPGPEAAVAAFLRLAWEAFRADEVLAVFDSGEALALTAADDVPHPAAADPAHARLLTVSDNGAAVVDRDLPAGWSGALLAPLESGGSRSGVVAVGWHGRRTPHPRDLTLLTPLASALAAALAAARHHAELVAETGKLRAVVEQSSDGILVVDGTGVVQVWNPSLERLTGYGEDGAVGRRLATLLQAEDDEGNAVDAFEDGLSRLSPTTPEATADLQIIRPDGERRSVRCAHAGTFDGDGHLVRDVVNVRDVTRERQLERLKSDFVATVSHELRTPVTPIKGYAEMLLKRGDDLPLDKRTRALEVIVDRAGHLARLVEDLLLAANISGAAEPVRSMVVDQVDLGALASRACEDFSAAADRLRLGAPQSPVMVRCDRTRAIQVLTNLLSNALKYSPPDTVVDVGVTSEDGVGRVTVTDRGQGLPSDQLERIFDKFHRVEDPMVMSTSGTGLGLYIARHLARVMGGDLTVASQLGVGSTFTFRLPLA